MKEISENSVAAPTLEECEKIIEEGGAAFIRVGSALSAIQDGKLYKHMFATFEDYCMSRWGWSRNRAYQLIGAKKISDRLVYAGLPAPANERQIRALASLHDADIQATVWREATAQNGGVAASGDKVAALIAEQYVEKVASEPKRCNSPEITRCLRTIRRIATKHLKTLGSRDQSRFVKEIRSILREVACNQGAEHTDHSTGINSSSGS